MADTHNNIKLHRRVSSWPYTTLGRIAWSELSKDQSQTLPAQPGDRCLRRIETRRDEQGVMSTLLIPHHDLRLGDRHVRRGIHEVLEQMPRLRALVAPADATGQQAVQ